MQEREAMDEQNGERCQEIARRVEYWRRRRGLTRRIFADRMGRSLSWARKISNGDRQLDRLSVLEQIADVLDVPVSVLIDREQSRRAVECVDSAEVAAIRRALQRYDAITTVFSEDPPPDPDVAKLSQRVSYAWSAFQAAHYSALGPLLGSLLVDAQYASRQLTGDDQQHATALLAEAYQVTTSTLRKLGHHDLEWLAAERGVDIAEQTGDPVLIGGAAYRLVNALRAANGAGAAVKATVAGAQRLQPMLEVDAPERLSLLGTLLLQGAVAASIGSDGARARDFLDQAQQIGERVGADRNHFWTAFGPTNVVIHRVSSLVELREWGLAIETAVQMDSVALSALPPERRANHFIDVARAYSLGGRRDEAVTVLLDADELAPKEVRCRPLARDLVIDLWRRSRGTPSLNLRLLAERVGLAA
jgi:transcriptional regulator with XRE-family HTH domain